MNQIERGGILTTVAALALAPEIKAAGIAFSGWAKQCGCRCRAGRPVGVCISDTTAEQFTIGSVVSVSHGNGERLLRMVIKQQWAVSLASIEFLDPSDADGLLNPFHLFRLSPPEAPPDCAPSD